MQLLFFVLPTAPELSLFISIANSIRERNRCPQNQSRLAHLPVLQFAEGLTEDQHMQ